MVQFNFAEKTIKAKVVFYGPAKSGKTTNLEQIHRLTDPAGHNSLVSLNTAQDRTLFFDLLPISLGQVSGYEFKIQVYTVPGQVQYNATRRVVLAGADAIVFVADSRKSMAKENIAAFENMKVNLLANRLVPEKVPLVLQYNKRDMPDIDTEAELNRQLNAWGRKAFLAVAANGEGVLETFGAAAQEMLQSIAIKYNLKDKGLDPAAVPDLVSAALKALAGKAEDAVAKAPQKPAPGKPATISPSKITVTQAQVADQNASLQGGADGGGLVIEELLGKAIKSNVDMAEVLSSVVQAINSGLAAIVSQADLALLYKEDIKRNAAIAAIKREADLTQRRVQAISTGGALPPASAPAAGPATRLAQQVSAQQKGGALPPPKSVPASPASSAALSQLEAALKEGVRLAEQALNGGTVEFAQIAGELPLCPPAHVSKLVKAAVEGAAALAPSGKISVRSEKKPVLLKSRDGTESKRDFLMLMVAQPTLIPVEEQQKIPTGAGKGALGEAGKLVREVGGFTRFAPTSAGGTEARFFLPM
jgi:signal recognition particle receptor subunit beta/2-phospho-L-lactate guanylyltransferase (CobY/MobA/RfbA family)